MSKVEAMPRTLRGRARTLRRQGLIPAVLYGPHLDPIPLSLAESDVRRLFSQITRSTMVELQVGGQIHRVFVKDVQIDPITTEFLHLDFYVPEAGRVLEMSIPVKIQGEAPGVKEGGVLEVLHAEIPVEAPPERIPAQILVDVSQLGLDEAILVRDLSWPEEVRPLLPPEDAVVVVVPPRKVEEAAPAEEAPLTSAAPTPAPTEAQTPATKSS